MRSVRPDSWQAYHPLGQTKPIGFPWQVVRISFAAPTSESSMMWHANYGTIWRDMQIHLPRKYFRIHQITSVK